METQTITFHDQSSVGVRLCYNKTYREKPVTIRVLRFVLFFLEPFSTPKTAKTKYTAKGDVTLRHTNKT